MLLRHKKTTAVFILLAGLYIAQSLLVAPDQEILDKYHITAAQADALSLTIALPYVIIWFIALIGYLRLRSYALSIKGTKDGEAFRKIGIGILLLTIWLPLSTLVSSFASQIYHDHPTFTDDLVRLVNYANVLILFPAFLIINQGSRKLLALTRTTIQSPSQRVTLVFIALSALYVFLTLQDPARSVATASVMTASYYQPDWLIITTLVIPRLLMWFLGIQAVYNIYLYSKKVKGAIYKSSLRNLAMGIGGVVLISILLRCLQSLSSQIGNFSLGLLLLIIYFLLIIISAGYILISRGANSLQQIEEL